MKRPVFGRNLFRISSVTATVLNETFRGISQSLENSAVSIANRQRGILPDIRIALWENSFCFLQSVQNSSRPTQPPIQCVPGLFPGAERPRHADNSSPSPSAEFQNEGSCTSIPPTRLRGVEINAVIVLHRDDCLVLHNYFLFIIHYHSPTRCHVLSCHIVINIQYIPSL